VITKTISRAKEVILTSLAKKVVTSIVVTTSLSKDRATNSVNNNRAKLLLTFLVNL